MKTSILRTTVQTCALLLVILSAALAAPRKRLTCNPSHCLNGGTCRLSKTPGAAYCSCLPSFFGPRCQFNSETQGFCRLTPCQHGGTCYQWGIEQQDFHCFCNEPFYGELCQYDSGLFDPCNSKPCKATETCVPFGVQSTEFYCF